MPVCFWYLPSLSLYDIEHSSSDWKNNTWHNPSFEYIFAGSGEDSGFGQDNKFYAINADGSPNTAHTTNPVPVFLIDKKYTAIRNGILADVAPTILKLMGIECPPEMTGKILIH